MTSEVFRKLKRGDVVWLDKDIVLGSVAVVICGLAQRKTGVVSVVPMNGKPIQSMWVSRGNLTRKLSKRELVGLKLEISS